jgi:hypothetical protein
MHVSVEKANLVIISTVANYFQILVISVPPQSNSCKRILSAIASTSTTTKFLVVIGLLAMSFFSFYVFLYNKHNFVPDVINS